MSTHIVPLLAFCICSWLFCVVASRARSRRYKLPPSVPGLPLIGNILQAPHDGQGPYLKRLGDKYGEMFTLRYGRATWVVLNSKRVVHELLEKRSAIYSSRPKLPMAQAIISRGHRMLLMEYGEAWRSQRRIMHGILGSNKRDIFRPFQETESKALLFHLLESPETWYSLLGRFSNSIIMSVVFGRRTTRNDSSLSEIYKVQEEFVPYMMPGASFVDAFPILANIPFLKGLQFWRRKGDALYERTKGVFQRPIDELRLRIQGGTQKPCFMTEFLASNAHSFSAEEVAFIGGTLIEAGTDTTRTSLLGLIAGTAMYPQWIHRARKELDSVCGPNAERLPTFDDRQDLPMIQAAVKESVRWRPANSQTGIPHCLIVDDEFEGYRFPAGTVFTWNNWGISLSSDFDEAERFNPDRFLGDDIDKVTKGHLGFGAGRRLCVGFGVAANNLFIAIARLVYCFDIEQDRVIPITVDKPFPLDADIEPYKVIIKPRSLAHRELIERECRSAALF
ncbi:unnamed protein product [Clonostachys rosea]|uniref:Cytochrome P450 n=1 Tax=Bionectria ochroleuca TaxID=29856 RepID=A0ABY6USI3_BIOOC|nr:unnamed protein product [Clonostachys rosea]